ncbi:hypothetical protein FRC01_004879, partial [Tulasnella sp. 417]
MARAHMAEWEGKGGWEYSLVNDEQLEVFLTCVKSSTVAAKRGFHVPNTTVRTPCVGGDSSVPGSPSPSSDFHNRVDEQGEFGLRAFRSRSPDPFAVFVAYVVLLKPDPQPSGDSDEEVANPPGSATTASIHPATGGRPESKSPPSKKQRLSEGGSAMDATPALPYRTPSEIQDAMMNLCEALLLEFVPGQRT